MSRPRSRSIQGDWQKMSSLGTFPLPPGKYIPTAKELIEGSIHSYRKRLLTRRRQRSSKKTPLTITNTVYKEYEERPIIRTRSNRLADGINKIKRKGELSPITEGTDETVTPTSNKSRRSQRSRSSKRSITDDDVIVLKKTNRSTALPVQRPRSTIRSALKGIGNFLGLRTRSNRS